MVVGSRRLVAACAALLIAPSGPAWAQASAPAARPLVLGAACVRPAADSSQGVVKRDACGRWYCGLASYKDPIEIDPKLAEKFKCQWKVVDNRCKCMPQQR